MGFDAAKISELFDYILADGTEDRVPEPTAAEAEGYRDRYTNEQLRLCGLTQEQIDAEGGSELFDKALAKLTHAQRKELTEIMLEATIEFCKGHPTREQITEMPALTQLGFIVWLVGVLSPLY